MGIEIVEHDIDPLVRIFFDHRVQKRQEILGGAPLTHMSDHSSAGNIQTGQSSLFLTGAEGGPLSSGDGFFLPWMALFLCKRQEIGERCGQLFPDFSVELLNVGEIEAGLVADHWIVRGTNIGPGGDGSEPTGCTVSFQGASIIRIEGDKILSESNLF